MALVHVDDAVRRLERPRTNRDAGDPFVRDARFLWGRGSYFYVLTRSFIRVPLPLLSEQVEAGLAVGGSGLRELFCKKRTTWLLLAHGLGGDW